MRSKKTNNSIIPRMLTISEASQYTGMGANSARKWLDDIGATMHFGRSVRFDRCIIDEALDRLRDKEV